MRGHLSVTERVAQRLGDRIGVRVEVLSPNSYVNSFCICVRVGFNLWHAVCLCYGIGFCYSVAISLYISSTFFSAHALTGRDSPCGWLHWPPCTSC